MPTPRKAPTAVALDAHIPSINMLVYGNSGVGKTVFGGGRGGADLVISCEKDQGVSARRQGGRGKIVVCRDYEDFMAAVEKWESGGYGDPEWTHFDSLTSIQFKLIDSILKREYGKQPERKRDVLQLQDHLEYQNATKRLIGELCDVPRNIIFTAQDMAGETEEGDEYILPYLDGKKGGISNFVCGLMTSIGYMKVIPRKDESLVRRIYWQPRPPYFAKDWTDALGKYTDDLTLAEIWKKIQASGPVGPRPRSATARSGPTPRKAPAARPAPALSAAQRRAARVR